MTLYHFLNHKLNRRGLSDFQHLNTTLLVNKVHKEMTFASFFEHIKPGSLIPKIAVRGFNTTWHMWKYQIWSSKKLLVSYIKKMKMWQSHWILQTLDIKVWPATFSMQTLKIQRLPRRTVSIDLLYLLHSLLFTNIWKSPPLFHGWHHFLLSHLRVKSCYKSCK